jgi:hypothetical protein
MRTVSRVHRIELAKGRNAMAIWQDLVDGHGFSEKYSSVKRLVRELRGSSTPEARVFEGYMLPTLECI